ncbi:uncharacterized protein ARMOST_21970 [Armillaria ostoyae]|uniref:Uncharacterized protein n=1 Tax=Armillaria ostoyae TaxID=47428 RepID=A0A284SBJ9_ARMOS|nr:uncharacterized protein ARMOST_21970 [Armillaria ostoyae]
MGASEERTVRAGPIFNHNCDDTPFSYDESSFSNMRRHVYGHGSTKCLTRTSVAASLLRFLDPPKDLCTVKQQLREGWLQFESDGLTWLHYELFICNEEIAMANGRNIRARVRSEAVSLFTGANGLDSRLNSRKTPTVYDNEANSGRGQFAPRGSSKTKGIQSDTVMYQTRPDDSLDIFPTNTLMKALSFRLVTVRGRCKKDVCWHKVGVSTWSVHPSQAKIVIFPIDLPRTRMQILPPTSSFALGLGP